MTIIYATQFFSARRLRVRRVDELAAAEQAAMLAAECGGPAIVVRHGGCVANRYGYPAQTEGVVAVAVDSEVVVLYGCRRPANKVTLGGVADVADCRPLFDERFRNAELIAGARAGTVARARLAAGLLPEAVIARLRQAAAVS